MKDIIFLMGMPGCGKSTFGKKLARKLDFDFIDLDEYIENKTQTTIEILFSEKGEHFFRNLESECLKEIISFDKKLVLSLGGGTPCFNDNLKSIKNSGVSIFLDASIKLLADRILNAIQISPMFKNLNKEETINKLEELQKTRYSFYKQADLIVNIVDLKLTDIIQLLNNHINISIKN
jgi:shikimate kinase